MATVRDICTRSLREIGELAGGESPSYNDASDALAQLNALIDQWAAERLTIHYVTRTAWTLSANTGLYQIGDVSGYASSVADGFDTSWAGTPPGWTSAVTGNGQVLNELSFVQAGGHAVNQRTGASAGTAESYRDFTVFSGTSVTVSIYQSADVLNRGFLRIQCRETEHWLTAASVWGTAQSNAITAGTQASYAQSSITFTAEDESLTGGTTCTIRVSLVIETAVASVYWDTFALTNAAAFIDIPRPVYIDDVRLVNTAASPDMETPLRRLTDDDWERIAQKDLTGTQPSAWYYNPTHPYGSLRLWPIPTGSNLQGAIYVPTQVSTFASLDTVVSLPPAYERALVKNLAVELCPSYSRVPNPLLVKQASDSLATLKRANHRPTDMLFENAALIGTARGGFNIRTGE